MAAVRRVGVGGMVCVCVCALQGRSRRLSYANACAGHAESELTVPAEPDATSWARRGVRCFSHHWRTASLVLLVQPGLQVVHQIDDTAAVEHHDASQLRGGRGTGVARRAGSSLFSLPRTGRGGGGGEVAWRTSVLLAICST